MAELRLTALLLAVVLSVQNSAAVDETELAGLVSELLNVYKPTYRVNGLVPPMFSLAVSVPLNPQTRRYDFSQVTTADDAQTVRTALDRCQVYTGSRVVGATLLKWPDVTEQCPNEPIGWDFVHQVCPNARTWADLKRPPCSNNMITKLKKENGLAEHAEYRVLQSFNTLVNRLNTAGGVNRNDLMLFYVYKAPCDSRCSSTNNRFSILQAITAIKGWQNYAVVFSDIFVPVSTSLTAATLEANRRTALMNLGNVLNGVGNIYRCVERSNQCTSCAAAVGVAATGGVANICVSDNHSRSSSPTGK